MAYSDDEDDGNTSFVPLSLADITATAPQRTYSSRAPPVRSNSSRPSHVHASSLSSTTKERTLQAKTDAAAMMESLGMGAGGTAKLGAGVRSNSFNITGASSLKLREGEEDDDIRIVKLKTELGDRDQTIESLRRQVSGLMREKMDLGRKCERLEREKAVAGTGRIIGAGEMEELEKAFASQESLLGGYQRDAEKSMKTIEDLKKQQRRLTQFLEKLYGSTWEQDLSLHLDRPTTIAPIPIPSFNVSPSHRAANGRSGRPSLSTTPSNFSRTSKESYSSDQSLSDNTSIMVEDPQRSPVGIETESNSVAVANDYEREAREEELKRQLDSVQALLRGMERRIIAREVELEAGEKRAKDGQRDAERKRREVESLVKERMES